MMPLMPPSKIPIPIFLNFGLRIFFLWPGEFIKPVWAISTVCASAKFSPAVK